MSNYTHMIFKMQQINISSIVLLLLLLGVTISNNHLWVMAQKKCPSDPMHEMDELINNIMPIGEPKVKPPTKMDQLPSYCNAQGNMLNEIEDLNKRCMKGGYRSMIGIVVYAMKRNHKSLCSKKSLESKTLSRDKKNLFQLSACIETGQPKLKQCTEESKLKMLAIQNAATNAKLPLLCCELIQIRKCILDTLNEQPACNGDDNRDKLEHHVNDFGSNVVDTTCADYQTEEKCAKVTLNYPKRKKSQRIPKSFLVPVLTAINTI